MTKQKNVRWKCPECGNHHSWYWSKYDVFPGEITMNCDNPKCEAESKMIMTVDKKGNATAVVYKENKELEDKLRRATEKVMNSKTEIEKVKEEIKVLEKKLALLEELEKTKSPVEEAFKRIYNVYPSSSEKSVFWTDTDEDTWIAFQVGYNAAYEEKVAQEQEEEPEELKTLYQMLDDKKHHPDTCVFICNIVKRWMSQYTHNVMSGEYASGYEDCMLVLEEHLK